MLPTCPLCRAHRQNPRIQYIHIVFTCIQLNRWHYCARFPFTELAWQLAIALWGCSPLPVQVFSNASESIAHNQFWEYCLNVNESVVCCQWEYCSYQSIEYCSYQTSEYCESIVHCQPVLPWSDNQPSMCINCVFYSFNWWQFASKNLCPFTWFTPTFSMNYDSTSTLQLNHK